MMTVGLCLPASVWNVPEKHILKELLGVGKLLVEFMTTLSVMVLSIRVTASSPTLFALSIPCNASKLIIHPALLLIAESHHGIVDTLERLFSLGCTVFIRVQLQGSLLVSLLEFCLGRLLCNAKDFVITAECQDFSCDFGLLRCMRSRSWFLLLPLPRWSCFAR